MRYGGKLLWLLLVLFFAAPALPVQAAEPDIGASSAIVIEASTGRVVYEKNADRREYPASLTKMMTCILGQELGDPAASVTISGDAAAVEDSYLGLAAGDKLSLQELLTGMMLESDNGAAAAVSQYLASSRAAFADKMNRKAQELGATQTHFHNPNGLPDPEHYSTARDLAKIAAGGMRLPQFRQIVGTREQTIRCQQPAGKTLRATNTNELLGKYPGMTGIKTGWTEAAGGCLAAAARRGGVELIAVVLHSPTMETRFSDAAALLDYSFGQVQAEKGVDQARTEKTLLVRGGKDYKVSAHPAADVYFPLIGGEGAEHYSVRYDIPLVVQAPVQAGDTVGSLIVCYHGEEVERIDMLADSAIEPGISLLSFFVGVGNGILQGLQGLFAR